MEEAEYRSVVYEFLISRKYAETICGWEVCPDHCCKYTAIVVRCVARSLLAYVLFWGSSLIAAIPPYIPASTLC